MMFDLRELEIIGKALRYYEKYGITDELVIDSIKFTNSILLRSTDDIDSIRQDVDNKQIELTERLESGLEELTLLKAKVIGLKTEAIIDTVT